MPKRKIEFLQHNYYHIYNRGAGRRMLFTEADNYLYVLRQTKKYCQKFNFAVIAYCLMPNHYHFLIRQDGVVLVSELPKRVFGGYSRVMGRRYDWTGTLFEGRYQAKHVTTDAYVLHLCRYVHANPVKDGLVAAPEDWAYSNYAEWIGTRDGTLVDTAFVREHFPNPAEYAEFVLDYLRANDLPDEIKTYLQAFEDE